MRRALLVLAIVAMPAIAAADQAPGDTAVIVAEAPARNAVSLPLLSMKGFAGIGVQYERFALPDRWSLAGSVAARSNVGGDYDSLGLGIGIEARYWLKGKTLWAKLPTRSMVGWYLGARVDVGWTRTVDEVRDSTVGSGLAIAETGFIGYRFVIRDRVEITPALGISVRTELDLHGRLPAWTRGGMAGAVTVGWMY
jgi:hypothetical protein